MQHNARPTFGNVRHARLARTKSTTTVAAEKCKTAKYFYTRTVTTTHESHIDINRHNVLIDVCVPIGVKAIRVLYERSAYDISDERAGLKRERVNVIASSQPSMCVCCVCVCACLCLSVAFVLVLPYAWTWHKNACIRLHISLPTERPSYIARLQLRKTKTSTNHKSHSTRTFPMWCQQDHSVHDVQLERFGAFCIPQQIVNHLSFIYT